MKKINIFAFYARHMKKRILLLLLLSMAACGKKPTLATEEPVRRIARFSIDFTPVERGYKPMTMYCNSAAMEMDFSNISFVRYGTPQELLDKMWAETNDTIPVRPSWSVGNKMHDGRLCDTYHFGELDGSGRYTLFVSDGTPCGVAFSNDSRQVNYRAESYTITKSAPSYSEDSRPYYYPESDEYYWPETAWDEEYEDANSKNTASGAVPKSIVTHLPEGASLEYLSYGDLNGDGLDDAVAAVERDDKQFESEPLTILIFWGGNGGYTYYMTVESDLIGDSRNSHNVRIRHGLIELTHTGYGGQGFGLWGETEYLEYSSSDGCFFLSKSHEWHYPEDIGWSSEDRYKTFVRPIPLEEVF